MVTEAVKGSKRVLTKFLHSCHVFVCDCSDTMIADKDTDLPDSLVRFYSLVLVRGKHLQGGASFWVALTVQRRCQQGSRAHFRWDLGY